MKGRMIPSHIFFVCALLAVDAKRVALTDSDTTTVYLCTGANNDPVQWSGAEMIRLMHNSQVVEVGPRGIRFVDTKWTPHSGNTGVADTCESIPQALCQTPEGVLFPSPGHDGEILVTGLLEPRFRNTVSQKFAEDSNEACDTIEGEGKGRTVIMDKVVYTASSCDVMQGHIVTVFWPRLGKVSLHPQTLGPMAYTVMLITALICVYGAASSSSAAIPNEQQRWLTLVVCFWGAIASCTTYSLSGISFVTMEDEIHFWMSIAGTLVCVALDIIIMYMVSYQKLDCFIKLAEHLMKIASTTDACIYMLGTIADTLYRGPETPYAGIFTVFLAVRTWQRAHILFFFKSTNIWISLLLHIDTAFCIVYLCVTSEVGLVPQYADREDWPIYAGVGAFITFLAASLPKVS